MSPESKRRKVGEDEENAPLLHFLQWCQKVAIQLNPKVYVSAEDSVWQYGVMTREDLPAGEVICSIPRSALLSQHTTRIQDLLEKEQENLNSRSGWVSLLISLMYEATDESSPWALYFGLWPQLSPPDLPMFWSEDERLRLLKGTGVPEAVRKDLENMEQEYTTIVLPFIRKHPSMFCSQKHSLDLYKRLVAFVMAYSFQEPLDDEEEDSGKVALPPMMVPVADLLNHVAHHNAHLEFTPECLRMVTTRPVMAGQEIFNTYGEMGNWQLLHMYGFSEPHPNNINETADIPMVILQEAAFQGAESEEQRAQVRERWTFLHHMDVVVEEGAFVFGCDGALTEDELRTCLKLLCMSPGEFVEYKENDGWEEDEDEDEDTLSNQEISHLPTSWRRLLHRTAELALKAYASDLRSDQALLDNEAANKELSHRERYSLHVRYGQKRILHRLLELTAKPETPSNKRTTGDCSTTGNMYKHPSKRRL